MVSPTTSKSWGFWPLTWMCTLTQHLCMDTGTASVNLEGLRRSAQTSWDLYSEGGLPRLWCLAGLLGAVETFRFLWKDFQAIKNMGLNAVRVLALAFLKDCRKAIYGGLSCIGYLDRTFWNRQVWLRFVKYFQKLKFLAESDINLKSRR